MSSVFFISDLHLGHKKILDFSPERGGSTAGTHSRWLVNQWNSVVGKSDLVWVLGDVCFDRLHLDYLKEMNGSKHLILGNHDSYGIETYQKYFNKIHGFMKYKGLWLSHAPIHPNHLRGMVNVHGHLHSSRVSIYQFENGGSAVPDQSYINVSVEQLNGVPISLEEIHKRAAKNSLNCQ